MRSGKTYRTGALIGFQGLVARYSSMLGLIVVMLASAQLFAEEKIIKSHGFSEFGDLKYPEGFAHFDYVNPNAPRGGELSYAAQGTFDSLNPFTRQGARRCAVCMINTNPCWFRPMMSPQRITGCWPKVWNTRKVRNG